MSTSALQKQVKAVHLHCARHCELPLSKMGSKGLFPGVAVPRAFFGTFFRFERKYCPLRGGSPTVRAGVGALVPVARGMRQRAHQRAFRSPFGNLRAPKVGEKPIKWQVPIRAGVDAAHTAMRSAFCFPELRLTRQTKTPNVPRPLPISSHTFPLSGRIFPH